MNNPTEKFFKVFIAGKYPQGEITEADLKEIAKNYNADFHPAPLTKDHERTGEALGRVGKLEARGKELFAQFSKITPEAMKLVREGKYSRPSIEIAEYSGEDEFAGIQGKYCRAITLTNFPQVKGLPDFVFNDEKGHPTIYFSEDISKDIPEFNKEDFKTEPIKKHKTIMKQAVITFAEKYFNITFSDKTEYEEAFEKVIPKVEAMAEKLKAEKDNYKELEKKFNEQSVELEKVQTAKVNDLVNKAFSDGKILPAQKADYVSMATKDYEFTETVIKNLPVNPALKRNMVNNANGGIEVDSKFLKPDGTVWKYSELLKPENLHLFSNYSTEEKEQLRNKQFGITA